MQGWKDKIGQISVGDNGDMLTKMTMVLFIAIYDNNGDDDDVDLDSAEMLVLPAVVMLKVSGFILSSAMSLRKHWHRHHYP